MEFNKSGYKAFNIILNPLTIEEKLFDIYPQQGRRFIVINDSDSQDITIRLNQPDADLIVVKALEYFGEDLNIYAIFANNNSPVPVPIRVFVSVVS